MESGRIVLEGEPDKLRDNEDVEAARPPVRAVL
jgi:hypothetical protein